jgi:hypothetical protein
MKRVILALLVVGLGHPVAADEGVRTALVRVLYVGQKDSARARAFATLLDERFILIDVAGREDFDPSSAQGADVVLLDGLPGDLAAKASAAQNVVRCPLGERSAWQKPTVLLGSAGPLVAQSWRLFGARGWNTLEPYAFDLRAHPLLERPIPLDPSRQVRRPWPRNWPDGDDTDDARVLALAASGRKPPPPGWCTDVVDMDEAPEVEVICGGLSAGPSTAAALWRQGNLLHFGFGLSPDEMNAAGKALLVDAISYIARFADDRPIVEAVSAGAGGGLVTRSMMVRTIARNSRAEWDDLQARFDPAVLAAARVHDLRAFARWFPSARDYLYPGLDGRITLDEDARELGLKPGRREFFKRAIARLARPATADDADQIRRLLVRYAPDGPGPEASARVWSAWFKENGDYLFFADAAGYRWSVDPLARARGEPTEKLRGAARGTRTPPRR